MKPILRVVLLLCAAAPVLAADAPPVVERLLAGEDLSALSAEMAAARPVVAATATATTTASEGSTAQAIRGAWVAARDLARRAAAAGDPAAIDDALATLAAADLLLDARAAQLAQSAAGLAAPSTTRARLDAWRRRVADDQQPLAKAVAQLRTRRDARAAAAVADALSARITASTPPHPVLAAGVLPNHRPRMAPGEPPTGPGIAPSYARADATPPGPDDRAPSPDAPFSDGVLAQATALGHDVARMFDFVRTRIATQWYAGTLKSPDEVLRTGAGNDVDQARLLVALLRAGGVGARFVRGVVRVPSTDLQRQLAVAPNRIEQALRVAGIPARVVVEAGDVAALEFEHTWVAAYVPFGGYRGAGVDASSPAWVPMMPALEPHRFVPPTGATTLAGLSAAVWVDADLAAPREGLPLARLHAVLESHFAALQPPQTLEAQSAVHASEAQPLGRIPAVVAHPVVRVLSESASVPAALAQRARVRVVDTVTSTVLVDVNVPTDQLAGRRVTLSFVPSTVDDHDTAMGFGGLGGTPAALIRVRPLLMIDGRPAAAGSGDLAIGDVVRLEARFDAPAGSGQLAQSVVAGGYAALVIAAQADDTLPAFDALRPDGDAEPAAARLLAGLGARYLDAWNAADRDLASWVGVRVFRPLPSAAIVLAQYDALRIGAVVDRLDFTGVGLDAGLRPAEPVAQREGSGLDGEFLRWSGLQGSALEHAVFESQWSVPSVSADRILQATPAADRLRLTGGSSAASLAHPAEVRAAIQAWLDDGLVVDTTRVPSAFAAWRGSVWRVHNLATGESGWFIAGGLAGGATGVPPSLWTFRDLADALSNPYAEDPNTDPLSAASVSINASIQRQRATAGAPLPQPLTALVRDAAGRPVQGARVSFRIVDGDARLGSTGDTTELEAITDRRGLASVTARAPEDFSLGGYLELDPEQGPEPQRLGASQIAVRAFATQGAIDAGLSYTAIGIPDAPARLNILRDTISLLSPGVGGATGRVRVLDRFDNPISNIPVQLSVSDRDGVGGGAPSRLYRPGTCGDEPVYLGNAGACAAASLTLQSRWLGAMFAVLPTNADGRFIDVVATAGPLSGQTSWNTLDVIEPVGQTLMIHFAWFADGGAGPSGRFAIDAAPPGQPFPTRRRVSVTRLTARGASDPVIYDAAPYSGGRMEVSADNGTASNPQLVGPGLWEYDLVAGSAPGPVPVTVTLFEGNSFYPPRTFTVASAVALSAPELTPDVVPLSSFGFLSAEFRAQTRMLPGADEYVGAATRFILRSGDDEVAAPAFPTASDGSYVTFARGLPLAGDQPATVTQVINLDTPFRLESPPARLRFEQSLITGYGNARRAELAGGIDPEALIAGRYPRKLELQTEVDVPNGFLCSNDAAFLFALARPAQVTVSFQRLDDQGDPVGLPYWTPLDRETRDTGVHQQDVPASRLDFGWYEVKLTARAVDNGEEEVRTATVEHKPLRYDALPLAQTLVKGVNVHSGSATVAVQDVALGGLGPEAALERTYASHSGNELGSFGRGWQSNLESRVIVSSCESRVVYGGAGQGQRLVFDRTDADGTRWYRPLGGYNGLLAERSGSYDFYAKDGTRYHYAETAGDGRYLSFVEDTNGNRMSYEYALRGGQRVVVALHDDDGRSVRLGHAVRRIGSGTGALSPVVQRALVVSASAPGNLEIRYDYDDNGNLVNVSRPALVREDAYTYQDFGGEFVPRSDGTLIYVHLGFRLATAEDALNGAVRRYSYLTDTTLVPSEGPTFLALPEKRVATVTEPDNGVTRFAYTGVRGLGPTETVVTDARTHETRYAMNSYGAVEEATDFAGTTRTVWNLARLQPASMTDANGRITEYAYDNFGNRTGELLRLGDRTINRSWQYWPPETFARPGIKNRERSATDGRAIITESDYDERGNLTERRRGGITERWRWSARGELQQRIDGTLATWTYGWDASGFPRSLTQPMRGVTQWTYDARGRKAQEIDPNGGVTDFEYDQRDRLRTTRHPAIDGVRAVETVDYDDALNRVTLTDARQFRTVREFDDMGRLLSEMQATGESRTFGYDANGNRTQSTDFRGNPTVEEYDAANRLVVRREPLGRVTTWTHDGVGNVLTETVNGDAAPARVTEYRYEHPLYARTRTRQQIADGEWRVTEESFDGNGNRVSRVDPALRPHTFEYDARDRLFRETHPLQQVVEYGYDEADRRIRETRFNPVGSGTQVRTWRHDGDGRLAEQVDAEGASTTFEYDLAGNRILQRNPRNAVVEWRYDARNRVIEESGPVVGRRITYRYDAAGNRVGETQPTVPSANDIVRDFDGLNRLEEATDRIGLVERIEYDPDGHVIARTNANGRTTIFVIDALGRVEEERRPSGRTWKRAWTVHGDLRSEEDPEQNLTAHAHDGLGRLRATVLPPRAAGGTGDGLAWTYDAMGNVRTATDARGNLTTFDYDDLDRKTQESTTGVAVGGALVTVERRFDYDTVGNLLQETDRRGITTTHTWDRENRRKTSSRDGTRLVLNTYDAVGNLETSTDALGTVTRTEYDLADRPLSRTEGEGSAVAGTTTWTYTPLGDALTLTDPLSRTTTQAWDERRRLVRSENAAGEATTYAYDGLGQLRVLTPPKGPTHASTRTYDTADRLETVTDGEGNTWTYGYDRRDLRTSISDPRGHVTNFAYDGRGQLERMTYPGGSAAWTYAHDPDGHRIRETSPDGVTRAYTVDALGRRRAATYTPPVAGHPVSTGYSYDANGNQLAVSDRIDDTTDRSLTRTWDRRDRIESETDPHGRTLTYTYDAQGNRRSRIDATTGAVTTYTYDARHRNTSVTDPEAGTTTLDWFPDGRLSRIQRPGGVDTAYAYDRAGRVETITHTVGASALTTLAYSHDLNGNRQTETLTHAGQAPVISSYLHDEADRLQSVTQGNTTTTYTLDEVGNRRIERVQVASSPVLDRTCTFDDRDRRTGCTDVVSGSTATYTWDATGRLAQETESGLTRRTTWDARERLLSLETVGGETTQYTYDPEGQRIAQSTGSTGERVQYDAGHRYAETNGAGSVRRRYQTVAPHRATARGGWARVGAAAMTLFLGMTDADAVARHYVHDALGTPVAITRADGGVAQRTVYDPWGNPTQQTVIDPGLQTNPNRIGFTGYVLDVEGSRNQGGAAAPNTPTRDTRYYAKARYYGGGAGSFVSVDPWEGDTTQPLSFNKYLYAYANPGGYVDPDGRASAAGIGFVAGAAWGSLQSTGRMIYDGVWGGGIRPSSEYLSVIGQNAIAGGEIGLAIDVQRAGGGSPVAGAATGALLSSGIDALTFDGSAQPWDQFANSQVKYGLAGGVTGLVVSTGGLAAPLAGTALQQAGVAGYSGFFGGYAGDQTLQAYELAEGSRDALDTNQSLLAGGLGAAANASPQLAAAWVARAEQRAAATVVEPVNGTTAVRFDDVDRGGRGDQISHAQDGTPGSPYFVRIDESAPGRPSPHWSIDTAGFASGTTTRNGGVRNAAEFWRQWGLARPETLSSSNRFLIDRLQGNPRGPSPRIDETWTESFPEHRFALDLPAKSRTIVHHHVDHGRFAIPVPAPTHVGSGGPWHGFPIDP